MSNYYYLVAGLPEVAFDGSKQVYSIDDFREDIYPHLSAEDKRLNDLFFLARDNENLMKILKGGAEVELARIGCYSQEQLLDIVSSVKNGDVRDAGVHSYLYDFLEQYFASEQSEHIMWSDVLSARYYEYAMSSSNKFIAQWFTFNLDVNNLLVALTARKYKLSVADVVIGNNEVAEALRTSAARDFGLSGTLDYLEVVQRMAENDKLQEREHQLDEMRWKWLDDNSAFCYFSVEVLFLFLQKLDIVARWAALDADKGMQRYTELINDLKGSIELPVV